jgi:hypothetical protein
VRPTWENDHAFSCVTPPVPRAEPCARTKKDGRLGSEPRAGTSCAAGVHWLEWLFMITCTLTPRSCALSSAFETLVSENE